MQTGRFVSESRAAVGPADRMLESKWTGLCHQSRHYYRRPCPPNLGSSSSSPPPLDRRMDDATTTLPVLVDTAPLEARHTPSWIATSSQPSPQDISDPLASSASHGLIKIERFEMQVADGAIKSEDPDEHARASALELKRLRNRECMRRARTRKMGELTAMKTEIAQLETQLRELQLQRASVVVGPSGDAADPETQQLLDALQRENFALRDEIKAKDKLREQIAPLLEQEEQRITLDEQQREYEERQADQFAWLRHVLPLLKLKSRTPADIQELVRQSCEQILASARHADASIESAHRVFGWSDKRVVDDQYVRFVFSKDFVHENVEDVTNKSWETSSDLNKVYAFQPRAQHMQCLHRYDENTIVVARNLNVPQRCSDGSELERNYCSVILLFRLATPSGFVVGTRTLEPETVQSALLRAGEYRVTYVDLCYGLLFAKPAGITSEAGCNVRFGGRAGNGTAVYARVCAMDVLLATLRWENHCIAPLNRLER